MDKVLGVLKKNWGYVTGAVLGGLGGYLYWYFVGCSTGTCSITASPLMSVIWGAVMGSLVLSFFQKGK